MLTFQPRGIPWTPGFRLAPSQTYTPIAVGAGPFLRTSRGVLGYRTRTGSRGRSARAPDAEPIGVAREFDVAKSWRRAPPPLRSERSALTATPADRRRARGRPRPSITSRRSPRWKGCCWVATKGRDDGGDRALDRATVARARTLPPELASDATAPTRCSFLFFLEGDQRATRQASAPVRAASRAPAAMSFLSSLTAKPSPARRECRRGAGAVCYNRPGSPLRRSESIIVAAATRPWPAPASPSVVQ